MADGTVRIVVDAQQAQKQVVNLNNALGGTQKAVNSLQNALTGAITRLNQLGRSSQTASTGASQLNRAISEAQRNYQRSQLAIAQLNAQLQRMQAQMMGMQASITQLQQTHIRAAQGAQTQAAATEELSTSMQRSARAAFNLHNILLQLGVLYGLQQSVQVLKEFDHAMAQVEAISGATGRALTDLRDRAKELGATTIYTSGEAATGMKYLAQSGFDVNEILAASGPVLALAQAGDIGLAQASEIAAKALRGFRMEATEMSDVADVMAAAVTQSTMNITELGYAFKYVAPIASAMGVDIREASAYIGVLSDAGIDATMAGTALRRIMSELSNPTIKATKLLASHGLTMADVDIQTKGLTETIRTLIQAGLSVGEVFALFGDRGAPAFQTLAQQIEKVEKKVASLQNVSGRAAEMQRVMNQSLFAAFKNLTSAIEFFIIQFSEGTGLLDGMKVALFGTAEGIRTLARNMEIVGPIVTALAASKIPALIAAIGRVGAVASATTALKKMFDISSHAQNAAVAIKSLSTQFVAARASGTLACTAIERAMTGVNTIVGKSVKGVLALTNVLGGPLNAALAVAAGAYMYFAMHQTEAEKTGERLEELLEAQAKGAEEYAKALDMLKEKVKVLDMAHTTRKLEEEKRSLEELRVELLETAESAGSLWDRMKRMWDSNESFSTYEDTVDAVQRLTSAYNNGTLDIDSYKAALERLLSQLEDHQTASKSLVLQQLDAISKMKASADAADVYSARLAILRGKTEEATEAQKKLIKEMKQVQLLRGEEISALLNATYDKEMLVDMYEKGKKLSKEDFAVWKSSHEVLANEANIDKSLFRYYKIAQETNQLVQKTREEMGEAAWTDFNAKIVPISEADLKKANDVLAVNKKLIELQNERKKADAEEKKSASGAAGARDKEAKAINKVNEELARMVMTDREFQQFKFEQELAKLVATVGEANPQVQELIRLWEKAKELGLSSPKELINARTSFEDFVAAKEHGDDKGWAKKAAIDAQAQMLEKLYHDDAQKRVLITQWAEDQKNQINQKSLARDTQSLLNFWDNYMNVAGVYNNQYSELLDKYYQERYQAYKQLCDDEVAARTMAEYDKLKQSKDIWSGIKLGTMEWAAENGNLAKQTADIMTNFYDGVADAMYDMVATGKANWEDLGRTVLKQFTMMIIKAMILANLMKLMGMIGSAIGGAFSGGGEAAASANPAVDLYGGMPLAKGGVFAGGGITDFSSSVVNSPTMFNYDKEMSTFASGGAVMGEAGWEGILPLGRNSRGELGVKADFGGGGQDMRPVIVTIHNYSDSEAREEQGMDSNGNQTIDVIIGDMAASQAQKPGSNLNRVIRNVAGVKQRVTRR